MFTKIFYQDFLFKELIYINNIPDIDIIYTNKIQGIQPLIMDSNLINFDNIDIYINLTTLMCYQSIEKWRKLKTIVEKINKLVIVDDIEVRNQELNKYKEFYLKVYYFLAKKYCKDSFVYQQV